MLATVEVFNFFWHVFLTMVLIESVQSNLEMLEVDPVYLWYTLEEITVDVEHSAQFTV